MRGSQDAYGVRTIWLGVTLGLLAQMAPSAFAQQRTFVNLGFEQPVLGGSNCYKIISGADVPGWTTDHPANALSGNCTYPVPDGTAIAQPVEIWHGPAFNGVPARTGDQHAELNAYTASRLFQTVCLVNGESIGWRLSHRGRNSAVVPDTMEFNVDSAANTIATLQSTTAGTGGAPTCAATSGSVSGNTCTVAATTPDGWRDYSGAFVWNGTSGNHDLGFGAIGGGGSGNFLDDIQITLRPFVELAAASFTTREGQAVPSIPQIRVSGTVPAGGMVVTATISAGGSASIGTDYTTTSGSSSVDVQVPAGTYDNTLFTLPITLLDDTVIEDNEALTVAVAPNAASYNLTSTLSCGGAATTSTALRLLDNDVDVATTKTLGGPAPAGSAVFVVTFTNNTARPTAGAGSDLLAHDASVSLLDAIPAGLASFSWTCAASGAPLPACPSVSGTGALNASANLPAGNSGTAGGTLTYVITAAIAPQQCLPVANTSTVTVAAPVAEGLSAQAGFTTPLPAGLANNTASASVDPLCADLSITKTNTPTLGPSDQPTDSLVAGEPVSYTLRIANTGPDAANDAVIRDAPAAGLVCSAATCADAVNGATCPGGTEAELLTAIQSTAGLVIPVLPATGALTITLSCTVQSVP